VIVQAAGTRTSSTGTALYRNGSSTPILSSATDTYTSPSASDLQWLTRDGQFNSGTLVAGFICRGMTDAQWATFASDLNAYMTAWGKCFLSPSVLAAEILSHRFEPVPTDRGG